MNTYPKIKCVEPLAEKQLLVTFDNDILKIYNCQSLVQEEPFTPLQNEAFFHAIKRDAHGYGIFWNDNLDISEAELWLHGQQILPEAVDLSS